MTPLNAENTHESPVLTIFTLLSGDFVILLMTGMSLKRALVFNFLASLTSFIGLYIGVALGENEEANQWIFSVTAGMFLYVAVADMVNDVAGSKGNITLIHFQIHHNHVLSNYFIKRKMKK